MKKITAAITAIGGFVPEDRLANFNLEKMVELFQVSNHGCNRTA